jgi:hypothetical protein
MCIDILLCVIISLNIFILFTKLEELHMFLLQRLIIFTLLSTSLSWTKECMKFGIFNAEKIIFIIKNSKISIIIAKKKKYIYMCVIFPLKSD